MHNLHDNLLSYSEHYRYFIGVENLQYIRQYTFSDQKILPQVMKEYLRGRLVRVLER